MLTAGADAAGLAQALAPWVADVRRLGDPTAAAPDWVFVSGLAEAGEPADSLDRAYAALRPGGHVALTFENRFGLHWLADWRSGAVDEGSGESAQAGTRRRPRHGLRWHLERLRGSGADRVACYALLPSRDAPRAIIPIDPPSPPGAQRMVLDQVWQRATPAAALVRHGLGWLIDTGLMRSLYPHYLLVGRKPC